MKVKDIFSINGLGTVIAVPLILYIGSTACKMIYDYKVLKYLKNINRKL